MSELRKAFYWDRNCGILLSLRTAIEMGGLKWQQENVKQHIIRINGMDMGARLLETHVCFSSRIVRHVRNSTEKDRMHSTIMKKNDRKEE